MLHPNISLSYVTFQTPPHALLHADHGILESCHRVGLKGYIRHLLTSRFPFRGGLHDLKLTGPPVHVVRRPRVPTASPVRNIPRVVESPVRLPVGDVFRPPNPFVRLTLGPSTMVTAIRVNEHRFPVRSGHASAPLLRYTKAYLPSSLILVRPPGLEPGTHALKVRCSAN